MGAGGCSPTLPKLGRNSFLSGKFSARTIGNSGNFSACSPAQFDLSGRKFTAPLKLTSHYVHGHTGYLCKGHVNALSDHEMSFEIKYTFRLK